MATSKETSKRTSISDPPNTNPVVVLTPMSMARRSTPSIQLLKRDVQCGWLFLRPKSLQRYRTVGWALFWLTVSSIMQGMIVNGFINAFLTTLERRFALKSYELGFVANGYDISTLICTLPVTYFGGKYLASKPKWIGWGIIIMGLGSLLFSMPHFLAPHFERPELENITVLCTDFSATRKDVCGGKKNTLNMHWKYMLVAGQFLHGAGATPLYTLGITYLDENVTKKTSPLYLAIFNSASLIGPTLGFLLGAEILLIHADFLTGINPLHQGITPKSPLWVGAWWIGFLLAGILCLIVAIPVLAFPPTLPPSEELRAERIQLSKEDLPGHQERLRKVLWDLTLNITFVCNSILGAITAFLITGYTTFLPKMLENQYSKTPTMASLTTGIVAVPAAGGGTLLGGYLIKRYDMGITQMLKFNFSTTTFSTIFLCFFIFWCPNMRFSGINVDTKDPPSLTNNCNTQCRCLQSLYKPVCGADNFMYYSPCYAGCTSQSSENVYQNCNCLLGESEEKTAINEPCITTCSYFYVILPLICLILFFTFMQLSPCLALTLRCVKVAQKSVGLGYQWIIIRLLGTVPAPVIFGLVMDLVCMRWRMDCNGQGSCVFYDNSVMYLYLFLLTLTGKFIIVTVAGFAWMWHRKHENISDK